MNPIATAAAGVANSLSARGLRYALVGGFAVSVRTEPRFTQHLDSAVVSATTESQSSGPRVDRARLHGGGRRRTRAEGRLATVRLRKPQGAQVVDLLFASSGIEPEIAAAAEVMQVVPGLELHVARTGHLIALKLLARDDATRPQDAADLRALREVVDDAEVQLAREAVALIDQRGFARDRDLDAALTEFLTD